MAWLLGLDSCQERRAKRTARRLKTGRGGTTERSEGVARRTGRFPQLFKQALGPRNTMKIGVHNSCGGNGEIELTSGAREAERLFDPERA
jgi:hypothetical protein